MKSSAAASDTIMVVRTEFELTSDNQALKDAIIARIQGEGGISFRDFMEVALYHPYLGYYTSSREKIGHEGDYLTSPEVSPAFGAILGRQLRQMWEIMGRPEKFQVVEAGAGTGTLCCDILRWASRTAPEFNAAIDYCLVEASSSLLARQREVIDREDIAAKVTWAESVPDGIEGCILSNELLDSMPVHRVVVVETGQLLEIFLTWSGTALVEELRPPSAGVVAYFETLQLLPGEGCRAEVNLGSLEWTERTARALGRGFALTLDYGYEAEELFAPWRRDGTLLCFYRHNASDDPYSRIGRQDMTSHVDFTSLRRFGEEGGVRTLGIVSQTEFLSNLGIADALGPPGEGDSDLEGYYSRRRGVMELLDPAGLGRIRVLVQHKGLEDAKLLGLGNA